MTTTNGNSPLVTTPDANGNVGFSPERLKEIQKEVQAKRAALWAAFDNAAGEEREYEDALRLARKTKSDAIAAIVTEYGKSTFDRVSTGETVSFAKRKGKDEYFVKGKADAEVVEV
jgi:hypothetical protein